MIVIRDYKESDAGELRALCFRTVRNINTRDYSKAQVEAWIPESYDVDLWKRTLLVLSPFVAEIDGKVVGYADLQPDGLIDHFFCHDQYQNRGVGRCLMEHIFSVGRARGIERYYSNVSLTARPFYEHFGFWVTGEQVIEIRGQKLRNFVMEKCL
ncbi:GNAT family N-acetyltransferase [Vibrio salinus]|uniref:GNAT family N-acetyltransferase n=1 Tax=Vibrio salinus TaxID=2899784 RepID=UPI001E34B7E7|nr:GNAT family N-acetyltransferase [Vibrio salinus]MCE0495473.1 GNAT family N-acetyltransferase [Vibrio salinus]